MPEKFKSLILSYCTKHSIAVPAGFGRNSPSRYAVIRTDQTPAKLVATTWFKQADVAYYFDHFLLPQIGGEVAGGIPVLDFKEGRRLRYSDVGTLVPDGPLDEEEPNQ